MNNSENLKVTDIIFLSFIAFLFLGLILFIPLNIIFLGGFIFPFYFGWCLFFVACPILLVFQIKEKDKTLLNKILLVINSIIVALVVMSFLLSSLTAFVFNRTLKHFDTPAKFEKYATQMIKVSEPKNKVVDYIETYKKQNGEYPKILDENVVKNKKIDKLKYEPKKDGYKLEIKYKNGKNEELEHFENVQAPKDGENSYHYSFYFKSDND